MTSPTEVTQLLIEWGKGNKAALEQLMPLVYAELRRMANRYMHTQNPGHTLQPTALIHEAYIRLVGDHGRQYKNRAHFFGIAAKSMRHVLVDHARSHQRLKRRTEVVALPLDEAISISNDRMADIVALDDALKDLAKLNPRQSEVVELKFFGGLTVEESAEILKISPETVMRDWRAARAWLYTELTRQRAIGEPANDA
jgi:RNA polymerase sigma-70 factor, ECF subfamily